MSVVSPQRSSGSARLTEMPARKLARITGILWIVTSVTSIPAVLLYDPLLRMASPVFSESEVGPEPAVAAP